MTKRPEPSDVFRETFIAQVPKRVRAQLRHLGESFHAHSLSFPPDEAQLPWNRTLLQAALLDLEHLERHVREAYMHEGEAKGWREERLAETSETICRELGRLADVLRLALKS